MDGSDLRLSAVHKGCARRHWKASKASDVARIVHRVDGHHGTLRSGPARTARTAPRESRATGPSYAAKCAIQRMRAMNEMANAAIKGEEHWTTKDGDVKLFLWEKCAGDPAKSAGTILFVHGSSMASQPTFDLQVPGRPILGHGPFRPPRLRLLVASTWKATAARRRTATTTRRSRKAPTTAMRRRSIFRNCAAPSRSWSTASHPAPCARRCSRSAIRRWWRGSRSTLWCGPAKARPRSNSGARSCPNSWPRTGGRSTRPSSIRSSRATIPAPPRTR